MLRFFFLCSFLFSTLNAKPLQIDVHAKSAVMVNLDTGAVLFEKNANDLSFPASITKIATALYVLEVKHADLSAMATVSAESIKMKSSKKDGCQLPAYWLDMDGTRMGLVKGEEISIESLLHGLMLVSGNDAANVLAETMSGSIPAFVNELNQYIRSIGCQNTHFVNPHGLHHPEHMTTAHDMCLIARKAMGNAVFREIVSKLTYLKPATNKHSEEQIKQFNHLLRPGRFFYPKAIGIKTGYTLRAQNTLAAAAEQDGRALIAVILGCEKRDDRYDDAKALFEAAFVEQKIHRTLFSGNESYSRSIEGATSRLQADLSREVAIDYYPSEEPEQIKAQICWKIPCLPIQRGAVVGEMRIIDAQGNPIHSAPLLAKEEVTGSFFFMLKDRWNRIFH
jgi:serine-type D-Ala-D-Ala carboxypeptidase (penicillin-binding protein 5/6)